MKKQTLDKVQNLRRTSCIDPSKACIDPSKADAHNLRMIIQGMWI